MPKLLIIDDERSIRNSLRDILEYEKFQVDEAEDGATALSMIDNNSYDAVLCDIKMPKMDGMEVLEKILEKSDTPVIMISGHGNIDTAVEAIKVGAFDYISKPLDLNRLLVSVRNALDRTVLVKETKALRKKMNQSFEMIGNSQSMLQIRNLISKVAHTDARVLICGENGTGKELVARAIHENSHRSKTLLLK
jgi:two-component system, NtrC family, nitrogen regulation response regulator NtrX